MPGPRFIYGNKKLFEQSLPSYDEKLHPTELTPLLQRLASMNRKLRGTTFHEVHAVWELVQRFVQADTEEKGRENFNELREACQRAKLHRVVKVLDEVEKKF